MGQSGVYILAAMSPPASMQHSTEPPSPFCGSESLDSSLGAVPTPPPQLPHHSLNCFESIHRAPYLDHLWRLSLQLVQSPGWPFRSSNAQKNYGTGSNSFVILLTVCVPSERLSSSSTRVRRSHRHRSSWQHSPNTKRRSTSSSHSTTTTRHCLTSMNSTPT